MVNLGYRWGVVEVAAEPDGAAWLASSLGAPYTECDGLVIYDLAAAAPTRKNRHSNGPAGGR